MNDEFWVLRPVMLITTGLLVLGVVLLACRQATEQRDRFTGQLSTAAHTACPTGNVPGKANAVLRTFPPHSLPHGPDEPLPREVQ